MNREVLRCNGCGQGVDTTDEPVLMCDRCGGAKWTNQVGRVTLRERWTVMRRRDVWVVNDPPDFWDKVVTAVNR